MTSYERQNAILGILCTQRFENVANLAQRFHVNERTIRRDILSLSCTYPIRTIRGRNGGGVRVEDWFQMDRKTLAPKQEALLRKLLPSLDGEDFVIMNSIIAQFALHREF